MEAPKYTTCQVCEKPSPSYTCPRCNARYCSLDCYTRHSKQCVESFSQQLAVEQLQSTVVGEEEKTHMLEILHRLRDAQLNEGNEDNSSKESSSSDDDEIDKETRELLAAAENGTLDASMVQKLAAVVKPWDPWWESGEAAELELSPDGTRRITIIQQQNDKNDQEEEEKLTTSIENPDSSSKLESVLPEPPQSALPPLSSLTSRPSPALAYHMLDILYAYCLMMRLFNGEYSVDPVEAASLVHNISAVLAPADKGLTPPDDSTALVEAYLQTFKLRKTMDWSVPKEFALGIMMDVGKLLHLGRPVVVSALMDLCRLCGVAAEELKSASKEVAPQQLSSLRRQFKLSERKLLFFLSWSNEQSSQLFEGLAVLVENQFQEQNSLLNDNKRQPPP